MQLPRITATLATAALLAATMTGCSPKQSDDVTVVTTTTMLGSVATSITNCAGGTVITLMAPGQDPHEFEPSSKQVTQMAKAKLVIVNGLELEHKMEKVLDGAKKDGAKVYEVGEDVDPIPFVDHSADHEHEHDGGNANPEHQHSEDPHFWMSPTTMAVAAEKIGERLAKETGNAKYAECGTKTATELRTLAGEMKQTLSAIPKDKRVLITDHEAFGYFAKEFDFEIAGVAIPGGSTEAQPSSEQIAGLVTIIKDHKVNVVFSNTATNPKLMDAVAKEVGNVKVVPLYVGSVGPQGSGAESYVDMMRKNAQLIADALR